MGKQMVTLYAVQLNITKITYDAAQFNAAPGVPSVCQEFRELASNYRPLRTEREGMALYDRVNRLMRAAGRPRRRARAGR